MNRDRVPNRSQEEFAPPPNLQINNQPSTIRICSRFPPCSPDAAINCGQKFANCSHRESRSPTVDVIHYFPT